MENSRNIAMGRRAAFPAALVVILGLFLLGTGVGWLASLHVGALVLTQVMVGCLIAWVLWRHQIDNLVELGALGFGVGALVLTAVGLVSRPLGPGAFLVVGLALLVLVLFLRSPRNSRSVDLDFGCLGLISLLCVVALALTIVLPDVADHPLSWSGWTRFHGDTQFHESLAASIANFGPTDTSFLEGTEVWYHWLGHAWVGISSEILEAPAFLVLTRVSYIFAIPGIALLAWSATYKLTRSGLWSSAGAAIVLCSTYPGAPLSAGLLNVSVAQSQMLSYVWLLTAFLLWLQSTTTRADFVVRWLGLFAFTFAATGAKVSTGIMMPSGAAAVLLVSIALRSQSWKSLVDLIGTTIAFLGAYLVFLRGNSGQSLKLGVNLSFLEGSPAFDGAEAATGAMVLLVGLAAVIPKSIGLLCLLRIPSRRLRRETIFGIGVLGVGFGGAFFLDQGAGSQSHFLLGAAPIVGCLAASGLQELGRSANIDSRQRKVASFRIFTLALAWTVLSVGLVYRLVPTISWSSFSIALWASWAASLIFAGFIAVEASKRHPRGAFQLAMALTLSSLLLGLVYPFQLIFGPVSTREAGASTAGGINAWHMGYREAGDWVRRNVSRDAIFVSNRLCSSATELPPVCRSEWYLASALTKRRFIVEGFTFGFVADLPDPNGRGFYSRTVDERIGLSLNLLYHGSSDAQQQLVSRGVNYAWIDRSAPYTESLPRLGCEVFGNEQVLVVDLQNPCPPS